MPWALSWFFPGEGRVPLLISVSGVLLIAVAVLMARLGHRFGSELGRHHPARTREEPRLTAGLSSLSPAALAVSGVTVSDVCRIAPQADVDLGVSGHFRVATISAIRSPASVGLRPTFTPAARSASILPCAVPLPPLVIAPAWPIFLPSGAVTPAM